MLSERPTNCDSQDRKNYLTSPAYKFSQWQKEESITAENVLESFLDFLEETQEVSKSTIKIVKNWVTKFNGYTIKEIQQAEQARLVAWKQSVQQGE